MWFSIKYIEEDYSNKLMQIGENTIAFWVNRCSGGTWHLPYPKEDLAQTFREHIWKKLPQYDSRKASFSTWTNTVIRNKVISMIRTLNKKNKDVYSTSVLPFFENEEL